VQKHISIQSVQSPRSRILEDCQVPNLEYESADKQTVVECGTMIWLIQFCPCTVRYI